MSETEITWGEVKVLEEGSYSLIDIRDDSSVAYGMIPGARQIVQSKLEESLEELPKDRLLILYCMRGIFSVEAAEMLREHGFQAKSLKGGYASWLVSQMEEEKEQDPEQNRAAEIELSIRKKFHRALFSQFAKAIREYDLVQENDKIAVCISGGKDSMLMAKLFQELKRHNKFHFELVFLVMDPGYSEVNRKVIENNAKLMGIPITVFETEIFDAVYDIEKSPCYVCARMRRGYLYSKAKELGCNKIALGHHYDDVIETILMGMLYSAQVQTMELIRPMYLIREDDIKRWRDYNGLHFIQCACRFTDTCTTCDPDGRSVSKRMEIKNLIAELKKVNPFVEGNIFRSVENVNLSTIVAYKKDGVKHSFLETYDEPKKKEEEKQETQGKTSDPTEKE